MLLMAAILGIGLLLGWGLGGGLRYLTGARVRAWWLAPVALALQAAPIPEAGGDLGRLLPFGALALSFAVLMVVAILNVRNRGFGFILLGLTLNLTVISLNQGMPVSAHALQEIGDEEAIEVLAEAALGKKHHLATDEDLLRFLGDVIPVRSPFDTVASAGDLFLYGGAAVYLAAAMLARSRRDPEPELPPESTGTWS